MPEKKPLDYLKRIEKLELELTQLNASRSLVPVERQLEVLRLGSSLLLRDQTDPSSPYYNRIKGFGAQDLPELDQLLSHYPNAAPCFDMTPNHMIEEVTHALSEKGFYPVEQLAFLYTHPSNESVTTSGLTIERVTEGSAEEFVGWIGQSMGGIEISRDMLVRSKPYFHRPDFLNYMLRIDGNPAAMASLFLSGEEGYLANDYTFEPYRGRGCQLALLQQRLADAVKLGVKTVYTDVEFGSISHGNMGKVGFKTAFLNTFWMKKPDNR
ncbi:GNAT family N-acetyltransferase [Gorillibacterium timonense]|uniref:GNAT family N-acetyltransferase n=1 Tax=Gorillibacterium timonense TaxID=1689269 RepID=UPI00071D0200|nr:GNAT family N-acetyltransferase [Gorillibacterium timonense]